MTAGILRAFRPAVEARGATRPVAPSLLTGLVTVAVGLVCCVFLASNLLATIIGIAVGSLLALVLRRALAQAGFAGVAIGAVVLMPFALPSIMSIENATIAAAFAIIAMSQYFITGLSGQMSLGQGALAAIGAYTFAVCFDKGVPWVLAILLGGLAAMLAGVIIGLIALRLQELYLAMVSLALVVALPPLIKIDGLSALTGGANGLILDRPFILGSDFFGNATMQYVVVVLFLVLIALALASIAGSRHGLALRALEFSEVSARASGVPLFGYRISSFILAAGVAGVGGGLYVMVLGIITPDSFSLAFSLQFLMMVVLGGMRRLSGAIVGGALVWWLHLNLDGFSIPLGASHFDVLPGAVFALAVIVVVLFFHEGVAGGAIRLWGWVRNRVIKLLPRQKA
ncbi:branched-chain amino acid ABC transporter permease [Microbacterium sp. AK031]|uniref:branched-chain amino acid ABC transporter permease n=1 Tax=Microbacterium sp. AK031 TaxID=2723076 RepID=UPI002166C395|nr:branched-chain amino acid ABC transporter permease [Microbacterium sp. AK031]MCS3844027.1 branched-chain amino acid transport system permease protein [Microbacterium sp. AK031]